MDCPRTVVPDEDLYYMGHALEIACEVCLSAQALLRVMVNQLERDGSGIMYQLNESNAVQVILVDTPVF